jgi:hypothetical protein
MYVSSLSYQKPISFINKITINKCLRVRVPLKSNICEFRHQMFIIVAWRQIFVISTWIFNQVWNMIINRFKSWSRYVTVWIWFWFCCLTPLSTKFQLFRSGQFSFSRKPEFSETTTNQSPVTDILYHIMLYLVHLAWPVYQLTTLMVIGIDCISRCQSN